MPTGTTRRTITTEVRKITPQLAEEWLSSNTHNRALRNRTVELLAGAMSRGEWQMNGDAIRFAADGTLLDGQHRLWAVFMSGVTIDALVIEGLPKDAQNTMDMGARRNLGDILKLRGETNYGTLAATIVLFWRRSNGHVRNPSMRPTAAQALMVFEANEGLREATRRGVTLNKHSRIPSSVAACVWYEFASVDAEMVEVFWERLISGIGLEPSSPILALRRYFERQNHNTGQGSPIMAHALFIKAWNAWREGRQIAHLTWRPAGSNAEAFPEVQ